MIRLLLAVSIILAGSLAEAQTDTNHINTDSIDVLLADSTVTATLVLQLSEDSTRILLDWTTGDSINVILERAGNDSVFATIGSFDPTITSFTDSGVSPGDWYMYRLLNGDSMKDLGAGASVEVPFPIEESRFFRTERTNALLLFLFYAATIVGYISIAKRGAQLFIRKIAGLDAVDEAVGRATEMGRKVLYIPGIMSVDNIQTVASMSILGYVAGKTASYGTNLEVPNKDPLVLATAREVVKEAYLKAGRPDYYNDDMVNYVSYDQFAFTAAIQGLMTREKPATNFLIGSFYAESLIMAEAGNASGAIQVAGTAELAQLPFFVVACDYTLIGEELYAASAYLSREPLILGSIKGQDLAKAVLVGLIILGVILSTSGQQWFADFFIQR